MTLLTSCNHSKWNPFVQTHYGWEVMALQSLVQFGDATDTFFGDSKHWQMTISLKSQQPHCRFTSFEKIWKVCEYCYPRMYFLVPAKFSKWLKSALPSTTGFRHQGRHLQRWPWPPYMGLVSPMGLKCSRTYQSLYLKLTINFLVCYRSLLARRGLLRGAYIRQWRKLVG
jgi:hypothetical protein